MNKPFAQPTRLLTHPIHCDEVSTATAGRGDPYWYEWFVGLREVVAMIDEGSDITSVAFQIEGVKGWDDVVVKLSDGSRRCYQVKHTREANSITFGDLVHANPNGESLLGSLFTSWRESNLNDGRTQCILYTNRQAGTRAYTSDTGVYRPPLLKFDEWLRLSAANINSFGELQPPPKWASALQEWNDKLGGNGVNDAERLAFIRAFRIRAGEDDLDGLDARVRRQLARIFGAPKERIAPFVDALHRALRKWTTGHGEVTAEEVFSELTLSPEKSELAPAPPPPEPFFPSREPIVEAFEKLLLAADTPSVIFLAAEPGAGKTSVVSRLSNRRLDVPLTGLIGLRYFCFEPIRPDAPVIAPDNGRVRPEMLWLSLLTQLREGLRGKLRHLRVPLRNDLLSWQEAKAHVLRLAAHLGNESRRPFVIVVDGIDHAARSAQAGSQMASDFFTSLPGPDDLSTLSVRLFVAGQPPEQYPTYPIWLKGPHPGVRRVSLGQLSTADVRAEYVSKPSGLKPENAEEAVRLIETVARGNTLATVFAVAEAANVDSLVEFEARLKDRRLRDGLDAYYNSIWQHAISIAGNLSASLDPYLVGTLCLARGGITAELLSSAFPDWHLPVPRWRELFESLRPLLIESPDGFRVRHNDVRLFLSRRFSSQPAEIQRLVASNLVDYYLSPQAHNSAAHQMVFTLLHTAAREPEAAKIFDVHWVFGAAAAGIESDQLREEFTAALAALPELKQWDAVLSLACAAQTLERLLEQRHDRRNGIVPVAPADIPPFLPSEAAVEPRTAWTVSTFSMLVGDAARLVEAGMRNRAIGLLHRWLHGMTLCEIVQGVTGMIIEDQTSHGGKSLQTGVDTTFVQLGKVARALQWRIPTGYPKEAPEFVVILAFERGYVECSDQSASASTLKEYFADVFPNYIKSWELAVEGLAMHERWNLVGEALTRLARYLPKFSAAFVAEAAWWALRSGAAGKNPQWLNILKTPSYGLGEGNAPITAYLAVGYARGWEEIASEPGHIAEEVYSAFYTVHPHDDAPHLTRLLFRAAAFIGRVRCIATRSGWIAAGEVASESEAFALLDALWNDDTIFAPRFQYGHLAPSLADKLAAICLELPAKFAGHALAAALPHAAKFPMDARRRGVWRVLEHQGRRDLLCEWVRHWLDSDGRAWRTAPDDRSAIVEELVPLARNLGENLLADTASERMRWSQIGYRSEERSFGEAVRWLRGLCRFNPTSWKQEGWALWSIADRCEEQFCSVSASSELEEAVMCAAIRCGPQHLWQLITATLSKRGDRKWHYEMRNRLGAGSSLALKDGTSLSVKDRLTLWTLVLAFCRWFDGGDIATTAALRTELLARCASEEERETLQKELQRLTPGESQRNPDRERSNSADPSEFELQPADYFLDETLSAVANNRKLQLSDAARAIVQLTRSHDPRRDDLIPRILAAIGGEEEYVISWTWADRFPDEALASIVTTVTDEQLWNLVSAASSIGGESRSWLFGIVDNLHRLAFARAKTRGVGDLRDGFKKHLEMHTAWAFGDIRSALQLSTLSEAEHLSTWDAVILKMLRVLFMSRSAEVLNSAITAMHVLVDLSPKNISELFEVLDDEWSRKWLLNSAEAWATLHPNELSNVRGTLEQIITSADLETRLQSWIVLCRLADVQNVPRPNFPMYSLTSKKGRFLSFGGGILETVPIELGFMRSMDRHASAKAKLERLRACGFNFSSLESEIAERLLEPPNESDSIVAYKKEAHRDNDFMCSGLQTDHVVGATVNAVLSADWCSQQDLARLAQGLMDNEDGWVLRQTPLPSPALEEWPSEELSAFATDVDVDKILRGFRNVAANQALPIGWTVIAAYVYGAHWREDFGLFQWMELSPSEAELVPLRRPTTPSGRTFNWWLGDSFEPPAPNDLPVLSFFTGGSQRLIHASVEIQPSKIWSKAQLRPTDRNPLVWSRNGEPVARYQRFHGKPNTSGRGPHNRQPLLERWIMRSDVVKAIEEQVGGSFRLREDFERRRGDFAT